MAVRIADTLKQQNDLKTFPVALGEDIWIDQNKGEGTADYKDLQALYNEGSLGGSGLPKPESKDKLLLSAENAGTSEIEWTQVDKAKAIEIPLYETKAAAEADIANLSDGQIIGTKDEGNENAKPVDVVQDGNMHAVTSNAVAEITSNHNGIFRGKCLNGDKSKLYPTLPIGNTKSLPGGGYTIEQVLANIAAGNFEDIYIGDYFIDAENKVYRIAGLDTELNKGDTPLTSHHAVIIPDFSFTNIAWNTVRTTVGGIKIQRHRLIVTNLFSLLLSLYLEKIMYLL